MGQRVFTDPPSLPGLFLKAALSARGRGGRLPGTTYRRPGVGVDRSHLADYQKVCGFAVDDVLPHTYPHVLAFPLQVALMTDQAFPLALPGLVHLENRITLRRRLTAEDRLDLAVRAEDLRSHPKGRLVDLVTEVDSGAERVWEGRSTYLRRGAGEAAAVPREEPPLLPDTPPVGVLRVPGGQGRAYAAVSGDVNPIHLHPLTAKAMGFPRAIAHGMWSAARTLAVLGPRTTRASTSHVWFARPVLLPSTVEVVVDDLHAVTVAGLRAPGPELTTHLTLTLADL